MCVLMYLCVVASCLRELRNEAVVFLAGVVRLVTAIAVVQQCCEYSVHTHTHTHTHTHAHTHLHAFIINNFVFFFFPSIDQLSETAVSG